MWYRKAADQGYADAQFNLGKMYEHGQGVPQSAKAAAVWYRKAADQGDAEAQLQLPPPPAPGGTNQKKSGKTKNKGRKR